MMDEDFGRDTFADDDEDRIAGLDVDFWCLDQAEPPRVSQKAREACDTI